ncbi:protein KASH5-like [Protopterus annectens]|uniref:protein KASH5-like n=1 Tax=Protopterus annectens TaxID=7888 RepID=UPI001CFA6507|nr:protein KASH5-like [Protopterus annectens]
MWNGAAESYSNDSEDSLLYSDDDLLNFTFKICDKEGEGKVLVLHIIEYLEAVTGQKCEEGKLKILYDMLDPERKGVTVDLSAFHIIMKKWIAECRDEKLVLLIMYFCV